MSKEKPLVPLEKYLEVGVHIGSRFKTGHMRRFIYKCRQDRLCVLDVSAIDRRLRIAAAFLSRYEPADILVVAGRAYAQRPAKKFAELIGARVITGRFVPGTMTNPSNEQFIEPKVVFAADPPVDRQSIKEAAAIRVPVVCLCDTSNLATNIDLVVPVNNKGKKALALVYWILAREVLKNRGVIKDDSEFTTSIDEFEAK